jgi:ABC-type sugar transport system permease subunit
MIVSLTIWNGISFADMRFVGLRNYINLFEDPVFYLVLRHNFIYMVLTVLFIPTLAFIGALLIERFVRFKGFFRTTLFIPVILPTLMIAILFRWVFSIDGGMINSLLGLVGLYALQTDFLGRSDTALYALISVAIWRSLPFHMTIIIAGLQGVPKDLEDAARIDGATFWKNVRYVIIPLLKPILTVVVGLVIIDAFRVFDLVFVMTQGGPARSTEVIATYIYRIAFRDFRLGYATAMSTISMIIVSVISLVYFKFSMKSNQD